MTARRRVPFAAAVAAVAALVGPLLVAQSPAAPARPEFTFDVVSVKPAAPNDAGPMVVRPEPGYRTLICRNAPLTFLISNAFDVTGRQISGGPAWVRSDGWDIVAKADRPGNIGQLLGALQQVLESRFQLKVASTTRQESALRLVAAPGEPKLTPNDAPPGATTRFSLRRRMPDRPGHAEIVGTNISMHDVAIVLSRMLRKPVIDPTHLPGT